MTIYYCAVCHAENRMGDATSRRCGAALDTSGEDYVSKLVSALEFAAADPNPSVRKAAERVLQQL